MDVSNFHITDSPAGRLTLASNGSAIAGLHYGEREYPGASNEPDSIISAALLQLDEYFKGIRTVFTIPLMPQGTEFQRRVWNALTEIEYGKTCTYGEIAAAIGNPKAARAVGLANNKNPISIIIPCHRVIGANGRLVGYAGGLQTKSFLLELEKAG